MANQEIKNLIKKHRLFRYEVAEAMGIMCMVGAVYFVNRARL